MIGRINVEVSAANPAMPLRPSAVFATSACTVGVTGVPASFGTALVTGVAVSIKTPDGETSSVSAKRCGPMWVATFMYSRFAAVGHVHNGLTVTAIGLEEDGETPAVWTLGKGDITVLDAQGVPAPGLTWQDVHLRDAVPAVPQKGDLAKVGGEWRIYTGSAWENLGGGDVKKVAGVSPNADGDVPLTAEDIGALKVTNVDGMKRRVDINAYATESEPEMYVAEMLIDGQEYSLLTVENSPNGEGHLDVGTGPGGKARVRVGSSGGSILIGVGRGNDDAVVEIVGSIDNGGSIKKNGHEVATEDQLAVVMDLVESAGTYSVQLGGVAQTFEAVKELAEMRNAVIRHGRGTYRVTYVGAAEMMWDCTGTVQGAVKTGTIHMFRENNVVQLVSARTVVTADDVVPSGSGTEVIATIGGKQIKAPAGGGGGGACLVTINPLYTDGSQVVSWELDGRSYAVSCVAGSYNMAALHVEVDGEPVAGAHEMNRGSMTTVAGPRLSIDYDGYAEDCVVYVDGKMVPRPLPATIDTDGHSHILIELAACLASDTLISMADGSLRRVCDIRDGERVLSVDPETMRIVEDEVVGSDGGFVKIHDVADVWRFDDGTVLRTVHPHEFFNVRTGAMEYIADFRIGDRVRRIDGAAPALVGHDVVYGDVMHNTLTTRRFGNYFAGGVLSGNRDSVRWGWMWQKRMGA